MARQVTTFPRLSLSLSCARDTHIFLPGEENEVIWSCSREKEFWGWIALDWQVRRLSLLFLKVMLGGSSRWLWRHL